MKLKSVLILLTTICLAESLNAQTARTERADSASIRSYQDKVGIYSPLFYGKESYKYPHNISGSPFYGSEKYIAGALYYDKNIYLHTLLRLDTYRDELCVSNPEGNVSIVLNSFLVDSAFINGEKLIYYHTEEKRNAPKSAYYIELHSGQSILYKKNSCKLLESTNESRVVSRKFSQSSEYYLDIHNEFYRITSKNSLLKALKTHKKELNRFIKNNRLNYKKETDLFLIQTIREYERLNL